MNKVITINLAGRSYSVEEPGYIALKAYLDNAEQKLDNNPDKEEILKDFNLAIAEKCDAYVSPTKNVILMAEIEKIIEDMGPVEAEKTETTSDKNKESEKETSHKKLYLLPDSGVIFGVCSGIAAYFDVDVTLVRIIFIALAVLTHGAWIFVYFVIWAVVPNANTPEEKAEAWGSMRMTAQDLLHQARGGIENFKNSDEVKKWKKKLKEERRNWHRRDRWQNINHTRSAFADLIHSIIGMAWLIFFIYIAWVGYDHLAPVRDLVDAIGGAIGKAIEALTEWIRTQTGQ